MRVFIYILLLASGLLTSCAKDGGRCWVSAKNTITKELPLTPFTTVEIHDNINYVFEPDSVFHASVIAGEKLAEGISITSENNQLKVSNNNTCHWLRDLSNRPTVVIYGMGIEKINDYAHGITEIKVNTTSSTFYYEQWDSGAEAHITFQGSQLFVKLNTGIGTATVIGNTPFFYAYNAAQGFVDSRNLNSTFAHISNENTGYIRVFASDSLRAECHYTGNIYYNSSVKAVSKVKRNTGEIISYN